MLIFIFFTLFVLNFGQKHPTGHLKPFGSHQKPSIFTTELNYVPQPDQFYNDFVIKRKPVVFRGAAINSHAYQAWTPQYIKKHFGDIVVRMEAKDEADSRVPATEAGVGRGYIGSFIDNYDVLNAYIISQIPIRMEKDIMIPPCLRCGYFSKRLQEINLFITAQGGKTKLHRDPYSNIHCVLNGTKDWIIVNDQNSKYVHQSQDSENEFGGQSMINVDKVNLVRYYEISKLNYSQVTLNAGDCIYMPSSYWHQVRVNGKFNVAYSIWFSAHYEYFDWKFQKLKLPSWNNCQVKSFDYVSVSKAHLIWRYNSDFTTDILHGKMDIYVLRYILLTYTNHDNIINIEKFCEEIIRSKFRKVTKKLRKAFTSVLFKIVGKTQNFTSADVYNISEDNLKILHLTLEHNDPSNTANFEYSYISGKNLNYLVKKVLEKIIKIPKQIFVNLYTKNLGGTETVAKKVFHLLSTDGFISSRSFTAHWSKVQKLFNNPLLDHDPTIEHLWYKRLRSLGINFY